MTKNSKLSVVSVYLTKEKQQKPVKLLIIQNKYSPMDNYSLNYEEENDEE